MYGMNGEQNSRYKAGEIVEKYCAHPVFDGREQESII